MKLFDRKELINCLKETEEWDIAIIGGGATGLGIAVDAATRGYKTLLVEQEDFAKGTSSRSTKLVHGGVRYLAQGNISLVKEALKERGLLLQNAPHLTRNESIIIPCYSWFRGFFYTMGLTIYDWLSGKLSIGRSKLISKKEIIKRLPTINQSSLKCGVLYHDGTFDDARLAINLAQTCVENNGVTINYCKVISLIKDADNNINGLKILDKETGDVYEVKAKVVVNATGVFVDEILKLDNHEAKSIIRPSQGIHLVLDNSFLQSKDAIMIPHTDDGRILFAIPWHNKVLVGTTDTPLDSHSLEPRALQSEIEFILKTAGRYLCKQPNSSDVLSVFAGLRPLAATDDTKEKTKEISRSHKVIISASGLVSVIGGKWTTYRKMAEDTLSKITKQKMLPFKKCVTENLRIHGYTTQNSTSTLSIYGTDKNEIKELIATNQQWALPVSNNSDILVVQIICAVRNEMARTVEDVLARRNRVLFTDARKAIELAPKVAEIMMKELHQDEEWKQRQIDSFFTLANGYLLDHVKLKSSSMMNTK
ncbi:MAG: glycerol-3-phosphate dehydrogenase/oxidase [Ginsengibacter sp.]